MYESIDRKELCMERIQWIVGGFVIIGMFWLTGCADTGDSYIYLIPSGQTQEAADGGAAYRADSQDKSTEEDQKELTANLSEEEEEGLYVHICGEVCIPGVYAMPEGSRIVDAVNAAGGLSEEADVSAVNLAKEVEDGMQIHIPSTTEQTVITQKNGKIDINHASLEELCSLPGIGESKASDIIRYRQQNGAFGKIEDIMKVTGIKQGLFEKIREKIDVQ